VRQRVISGIKIDEINVRWHYFLDGNTEVLKESLRHIEEQKQAYDRLNQKIDRQKPVIYPLNRIITEASQVGDVNLVIWKLSNGKVAAFYNIKGKSRVYLNGNYVSGLLGMIPSEKIFLPEHFLRVSFNKDMSPDAVKNDLHVQLSNPIFLNARDANAAMLGFTDNGGIDLTSSRLNLQLHNGGQAIRCHIDPAQLAELQNAPGFVPVIINIQPLKSLSEFLGLNQPQARTQPAATT
jgi:hypothetical protein